MPKGPYLVGHGTLGKILNALEKIPNILGKMPSTLRKLYWPNKF